MASEQYHAIGQQPQNEMNRLSEENEAKAAEGQRGDEDEQLQYLLMQADEGNVDAMVTVGR